MTTRLDISIGPVQGFVAQSRRTRDLWGSSYLLSFLCGHALQSAEMAGGRIVRPAFYQEDPLFLWIAGKGKDSPPRVGSLPNHLVIEVDGEPAEARRVAEAARNGLFAAWKQVCLAVWNRFVAKVSARGSDTDRIWNRQVEGFWEVTWVAGPANARGLLARRKYWRTHAIPDEPGDKCTVMPDFQELSGFIRAESRASREKQDAFWEAMRADVGPLDLRDNERLCAVALVKRLFPRVSEEALGWDVDTKHWPSTVYIAAVPWIRKVQEHAADQAQQYAEAVLRHVKDARSEWNSSFQGLNDQARRFAQLDGNYYHANYVRNERLSRIGDAQVREELAQRLAKLREANADGERIGAPPVYYALLLADGDRLGQLVSVLGGDQVGAALKEFTKGVPGIVNRHDGVTVYAGGDDAMAMLPVENALPCAAALAEAYRKAFEAAGGRSEAKATLSAAVLFTHIRTPLSSALKALRGLLEEDAKEANGRDSLAAGVLRRAGVSCRWVTTWQRAQGAERSAVKLIDRVVQAIRTKEIGETGLSRSLAHRLQEDLGRLGYSGAWRPGQWAALPDTVNLDLKMLVQAALEHSLEKSRPGSQEAENPKTSPGDLAEDVAELLRPARNQHAGLGSPTRAVFGLDGLVLALFLAGGGQEE